MSIILHTDCFLEKFSELAVYKDLKDFWDRRFSDADSLR